MRMDSVEEADLQRAVSRVRDSQQDYFLPLEDSQQGYFLPLEDSR